MNCPGCVSCIFDNPNIPSDAHEIHITVENADVDRFKHDCAQVGAKPVLIAMQDANGGTFEHLMTSDTVRSDDHDYVLSVAHIMAGHFKGLGYDVSRVKIETTLTNPMANKENRTFGYFESHVELKVPHVFVYEHPEWMDTLRNAVDDVNPTLKLSRNPFKVNYEDFTVSYFATLRETRLNVNAHIFNKMVESTVEGLSKKFRVGKVRTEFAWYDSNFELDSGWK